MAYKAILVDMFNLAYRKYKKQISFTMLANTVVKYIDTELKPRLETDGTLYLLFDPIPKSDLGLSKNFNYHPFRQGISSDYKANRQYNQEVFESVKLLKKYYTYQGDKIKIGIAPHLEADDFVEGIIEKESTGKIMLVSNDGDWARYISDRVVMINKSIDKPYTKEEYFKENGMIPSIVNITLKKALFGDRADNIHGVTLDKKINYYTDLKDTIDSVLLEISKDDKTLEEVEQIFKNVKYHELIKNKDKNPYEELAHALMATDNTYIGTNNYTNCWETFLMNIRLIKSRGKDIYKYIFSKPVNEKFNKLMDVTIGKIKKVSSNHKFNFGNVKQN